MTVLILNLGTADLSIDYQYQGRKYFLPVGFISNVNFNTKFTGEDTEVLKYLWKNKFDIVTQEIFPPQSTNDFATEKNIENDKKSNKINLDFICNLIRGKKENKSEVKTTKNKNLQRNTFREITKIIRDKSHDNWHDWCNRIRFSRQAGVVKDAISEFNIDTIYCFVSNQNPPHEKDTIHLLDIFKQWIENEIENGKNIEIKSEYLTSQAEVMFQDDTLNFYHKFFKIKQELKSKVVLISTLGGTPQMQTALKMQSILADIPKLLFLEPEGSAQQILTGQTPSSKKKHYWRFMQNLKYSNAIMLLEKRWDFDGAKLILNNWQETLNFLEQHTDEQELQQDRDKLKQVISKLDIAIACLNFDRHVIQNDKVCDPFLNLYSQCRMYWEMNQIANFLSRLGSFYEAVLCKLIKELGGEKYFENSNENGKWNLDAENFRQSDNLLQLFNQEENNRRNDKKLGYIDNQCGSYRLFSRYNKRNFVSALIDDKNNNQQKRYWKKAFKALRKIDYWVDKRNELIHSSRGMSLDTMQLSQQEDCQIWNQETATRFDPNPNSACQANAILEEITKVSLNVFKILSVKPHDCIGYENNSNYYIYSRLTEEITDLLQ